MVERFDEFLTAARQENLLCPLVSDSREICLQFHSKGGYVRSCMLLHASLWFQDRDNLISSTGKCRANVDAARKQTFSGGSGRGSYGVQLDWNRWGDHIFHGQNPDSHTPGISVTYDIGKGNPCGIGWHDVNHGRNGGARGGQGYNPTPPPPSPPTKTDRGRGEAARIIGK